MNREKQVRFSKLVHNNWNLPKGKTLWIHGDEKWFYGLVPRANAKACEELGVKVQSYSAHHKNSISKVMCHATVGFLFDKTPENGGEGFLIGLQRCQGMKMALRNTGKRKLSTGVSSKQRGLCYPVDCNITGSDIGTPTEPKFALKDLWQHFLFPVIESL